MSSQEQVTLLTDYDTASTYTIAYQSVFNNIRFSWNDEQKTLHTILLATPSAYAGYTAAPVNIAIAAAQNGMATLLIDANLQEPGILQRFGINDKAGLSKLLAQETLTTQEVVATLHPTFIPGLTLLGGGLAQTQDSQRLPVHKLAQLLTILQQMHINKQEKIDLIIFNSPPILSGIDASIISSQVEQTFLLIAAGHTTRTQARQAHERLERAHARLTGLIMLEV